jgi:hypothetical protein
VSQYVAMSVVRKLMMWVHDIDETAGVFNCEYYTKT